MQDCSTDFEFLPIDVSLGRCQRYCFTIRGNSDYSAAFSRYQGFGNGTNQFISFINYPVRMRTIASLISSGFTAGNLDLYNFTTNGGLTFSSVSLGEGDIVHTHITLVCTSGVSTGQICSWRWNGNPDAFVGFDAEL